MQAQQINHGLCNLDQSPSRDTLVSVRWCECNDLVVLCSGGDSVSKGLINKSLVLLHKNIYKDKIGGIANDLGELKITGGIANAFLVELQT